MKFGKIRIEEGKFIFTRHMMVNYLPCEDILWAYMRREGVEGGQQKQFSTSSLVIVTRRHKLYQFDMTDKEIRDCIRLLQILNPEMASGYPRGGRIHLLSLPNTRDLGALETEDGRHILPRRLLRSGNLYHTSLADQDVLLNEYRLTEVVDFRTGFEIRQKPDTVMKGVITRKIPILDEETMGITQAGSLVDMLKNFPGVPEEFIQNQYINLVRDSFSVKQYARFLDVVLRHEKGALLWHCSAGKDRVGIGTALLLCALGVPRETIREDFLKTNLYMDEEMQHMVRYLETKMIVDNEIMDKIRLLYKVRIEYMDAAFSAVIQDYGTVENYLKRALYMTPKAIAMLRRKYLV